MECFYMVFISADVRLKGHCMQDMDARWKLGITPIEIVREIHMQRAVVDGSGQQWLYTSHGQATETMEAGDLQCLQSRSHSTTLLLEQLQQSYKWTSRSVIERELLCAVLTFQKIEIISSTCLAGFSFHHIRKCSVRGG